MAAEIVLDTSVILAALMNEPQKSALVSATRGATLCVPGSVPWETGNALSSLIKRHRLTATDAKRILHVFQKIPLQHVEIDLGKAVHLAAELGIYAYDAYFLEAARMRKCGLLTLDHGLTRAAQTAGISLIEVKQ
jgi:predicted nucleic acid-binding protein